MRLDRSTQAAVYFLCVLMLVLTPWARGRRNKPIQSRNPESSRLKSNRKNRNPKPRPLPVRKLYRKPHRTRSPASSACPFKTTHFGVNPGYRTQDVLNIQPVIPIGISKDWNLIVRWIAPIVYQPLPNQPSTPETGAYGLGDMVPSFFISPGNPGKLIWGVGPVLQLPTATSSYLGQGKLGLGPTAVALMQPGHWTLGVLVNNVWSVAGSAVVPM